MAHHYGYLQSLVECLVPPEPARTGCTDESLATGCGTPYLTAYSRASKAGPTKAPGVCVDDDVLGEPNPEVGGAVGAGGAAATLRLGGTASPGVPAAVAVGTGAADVAAMVIACGFCGGDTRGVPLWLPGCIACKWCV